MKTQLCFIVTIDSPTGFHDVIVSTKQSVVEAVADGVRWYRHAANDPKHSPTIKAERAQILSARR